MANCKGVACAIICLKFSMLQLMHVHTGKMTFCRDYATPTDSRTDHSHGTLFLTYYYIIYTKNMFSIHVFVIMFGEKPFAYLTYRVGCMHACMDSAAV